MERIFRLGCPQCKRIFPVDYAIRFLAIQFECPYCRRKFFIDEAESIDER